MYFHHFISKDMHRYFIRILGSLQLLIICLYKQEVDPCKSITDEDIRTTIQNSGGPKGAMFLPEVCVWLDYVCISNLCPFYLTPYVFLWSFRCHLRFLCESR